MPERVCEKCGQKKSDTISLFRFPKQEDCKKKWIEFVGNEHFVPKGHSALCSLHFKESDAKKGKTRTMKVNPIPYGIRISLPHRGGAPEATPCILETIHQKVTKLLEHTYVGKCQGFKA